MKHLILWLDYKIPSVNLKRGRHWSQNHAERKAATAALKSVYQSSPSAAVFWTQTILLLGRSKQEMSSQKSSNAQTTNAQALNGNTIKSSPEAPKEH